MTLTSTQELTSQIDRVCIPMHGGAHDHDDLLRRFPAGCGATSMSCSLRLAPRAQQDDRRKRSCGFLRPRPLQPARVDRGSAQLPRPDRSRRGRTSPPSDRETESRPGGVAIMMATVSCRTAASTASSTVVTAVTPTSTTGPATATTTATTTMTTTSAATSTSVTSGDACNEMDAGDGPASGAYSEAALDRFGPLEPAPSLTVQIDAAGREAIGQLLKDTAFWEC